MSVAETFEQMRARHEAESAERERKAAAEERAFWKFLGYAAAVGLVVAVCCLVSAGMNFFGFHRQVSDGVRVGVVTKLSSRGRFWKTWEADTVVGSTDIPGVGTTWSFTVDEDGPIDAVNAAVRSGRKVRMHYVEWWYGGTVNGDTNYRVIAVEEVPR